MKPDFRLWKLSPDLLSPSAHAEESQNVLLGHLIRDLLRREARRSSAEGGPATSTRLVTAVEALLSRDLSLATDWGDLACRLAAEGYELRAEGAGAALYRQSCGRRICDLSALGVAYQTLARRFGAPMPGHPAG